MEVPCYDTSLYFDDLHLSSESDTVRLLQEEAMQGYNEGFRAFKIKVGRGAMHMDLVDGTKRDIAIVNGIREAVGPECKLMIDANNGYNLNLTKHVLKETASSNLSWIEEAFHEDDCLYRNLKEWMSEQKLNVLITDGEGHAAPHHYGVFYGNYASAQAYPAIPGFMSVEWDETHIPGIDTSGYSIHDGIVALPSTPGFGLHLDDTYYEGEVRESGWTV